MDDLEKIDAQLSAIEAAMASGTRVVVFDGHRMEYQETSEMLVAANDLRRRRRALVGISAVRANVGAFSRY